MSTHLPNHSLSQLEVHVKPRALPHTRSSLGVARRSPATTTTVRRWIPVFLFRPKHHRFQVCLQKKRAPVGLDVVNIALGNLLQGEATAPPAAQASDIYQGHVAHGQFDTPPGAPKRQAGEGTPSTPDWGLINQCHRHVKLSASSGERSCVDMLGCSLDPELNSTLRPLVGRGSGTPQTCLSSW